MAAYKKKEIRAPYLHDAHLVNAQQHPNDGLPAVSMQGDSTPPLLQQAGWFRWSKGSGCSANKRKDGPEMSPETRMRRKESRLPWRYQAVDKIDSRYRFAGRSMPVAPKLYSRWWCVSPAAVRRVAFPLSASQGFNVTSRKMSRPDLCIHCLVGGVMDSGCSGGRGRMEKKPLMENHTPYT